MEKRARMKVSFEVLEKVLGLREANVRIRIVDREPGDCGSFWIWLEGDGLPDNCRHAPGNDIRVVSPVIRADFT